MTGFFKESDEMKLLRTRSIERSHVPERGQSYIDKQHSLVCLSAYQNDVFVSPHPARPP